MCGSKHLSVYGMWKMQQAPECKERVKDQNDCEKTSNTSWEDGAHHMWELTEMVRPSLGAESVLVVQGEDWGQN